MRIRGRPAGWVGAALVVAVAALVLYKACGKPDYWTVTVPGVLTGCGTLSLAGVTYLVLRGDQRDRRTREAQDRILAEREHRAQAARVQVTEPRMQDCTPIDNGYHVSYRVVVANQSDDTIGRATIMFVVDPFDAQQSPIDHPVKETPRIVAGGTAEHTMTVTLWRTTNAPVPVDYRVLVWFTFLDAAGSWWVRDPDFRLIEISEDQAREMSWLSRVHRSVYAPLMLAGLYDPVARGRRSRSRRRPREAARHRAPRDRPFSVAG